MTPTKLDSKLILEVIHKIEVETLKIPFVKSQSALNGLRDNILEAVKDLDNSLSERPMMTENDIGLLIYKTWNHFSDKQAIDYWTAKHHRSEIKNKCAELAHALSGHIPAPEKVCPECQGKGGWYEHTYFIKCEGCDGTGYMTKEVK